VAFALVVSRADDNFHFAVAVQIENRDDFAGVREDLLKIFIYTEPNSDW
jgi:hypothetical protein